MRVIVDREAAGVVYYIYFIFLLPFLEYAIQAWCTDLLFFELLGYKDGGGCVKKRNWKTCLVPGAYLGTGLFFYYMPYVFTDAILPMLLLVLIVTAVSYVPYRGQTAMKSYLAVTYLAIHYLGYNACDYARELMFLFQEKACNAVWEMGVSNYWFYNCLIIIPSWLLYWALVFGALYLPVRLLIRKFRHKDVTMTLQKILFLLIPGISGILCGFLVHRFRWILEETMGMRLIGAHSKLLLLIAVNSIILLASILITTILFQSLEDRKEEEMHRLMLENQVADLSSHIREVEQLYAGIRGMKHDIRNHISNMEALLTNGQYEEAKEYGGELEQAMKRLEYRYQTGNPVTDVIINEKAVSAQEQGISFRTEFTFPLDTQINAFDMSILLKNGLDNAMEACAKIRETDKDSTPFIHISSIRNKNSFLIQIENSFCGSLKRNGDGLPATTKREGREHGMGLVNIRTIAGKYAGDIDIETGENTFLLTILLMCSGLNSR